VSAPAPGWLAPLASLPALAEARRTLAASGRVVLSGLVGPARGLVPLLLARAPLLVVVPRERDVDETAQDLRTLAAEAALPGAVLALPAPGPPPFRGLPRHADASARRAAALLQARAARAVVASPASLLGPSLSPPLIETRVVSLRAGDEVTAEMSRRHNDLNVLCLSAELLGPELQDKMLRTWLATPFEGGRHARRVAKITALEPDCT